MELAAKAGIAAAASGGAGLSSYGAYHLVSDSATNETVEVSIRKFDEKKPLGLVRTKKYANSIKVRPNPILYKKDDYIEFHAKKGVLTVPENKLKLVKYIPENIDWWVWAHKKFFLPYQNKNKNLEPVFAKVSRGWDDTGVDQQYLAFACHHAYELGYSMLKKNNNKLLKEISRFCTATGNENELKMVGKPEPDKFLKDKKSVFYHPASHKFKRPFEVIWDNKATVVDTRGNVDWWEWHYDNFFTKWKADSANTGKLTSYFANVNRGYEFYPIAISYQWYKDTQKDDDKTALNQACNAVYKLGKKEFDDTSDLLNQVKLFCAPEEFHSTRTLRTPEKNKLTKEEEDQILKDNTDVGLAYHNELYNVYREKHNFPKYYPWA